jgi:hypothetical protein
MTPYQKDKQIQLSILVDGVDKVVRKVIEKGFKGKIVININYAVGGGATINVK